MKYIVTTGDGEEVSVSSDCVGVLLSGANYVYFNSREFDEFMRAINYVAEEIAQSGWADEEAD